MGTNQLRVRAILLVLSEEMKRFFTADQWVYFDPNENIETVIQDLEYLIVSFGETIIATEVVEKHTKDATLDAASVRDRLGRRRCQFRMWRRIVRLAVTYISSEDPANIPAVQDDFFRELALTTRDFVMPMPS